MPLGGSDPPASAIPRRHSAAELPRTCTGALGRNRTSGSVVRSHALCPLSYERIVLVDLAGIEPATLRLQGGRSPAELQAHFEGALREAAGWILTGDPAFGAGTQRRVLPATPRHLRNGQEGWIRTSDCLSAPGSKPGDFDQASLPPDVLWGGSRSLALAHDAVLLFSWGDAGNRTLASRFTAGFAATTLAPP